MANLVSVSESCLINQDMKSLITNRLPTLYGNSFTIPPLDIIKHRYRYCEFQCLIDIRLWIIIFN